MHILGYEVLSKFNQMKKFHQQSLTIDQNYMLIGSTMNINKKKNYVIFFVYDLFCRIYGEELTQVIASTKGNWKVIPIPITNLIQQKYVTPSPFVS